MKKLKLEKILVISVAAFFAMLYLIFIWINMVCPKTIDINNQLTFGNKQAFVRIVLFEDFNCKNCKIFAHQILPQIKEKYIDTNKVSFTIIPLAFVCGGDRFANAALSAYELNKEQFFNYMASITQKGKEFDSQESFIAEYKKIDPQNEKKFRILLEQKKFKEYLDENLYLAKVIMRNRFRVPTMYINGTYVSSQSLEKIIFTIEEIYSKKANNAVF